MEMKKYDPDEPCPACGTRYTIAKYIPTEMTEEELDKMLKKSSNLFHPSYWRNINTGPEYIKVTCNHCDCVFRRDTVS